MPRPTARSKALGWFCIGLLILFVTVPSLKLWVEANIAPTDRLTFDGILIALATMTLVAFQIGIASHQTELQKQEIELVKSQGLILAHQEAEMNRKARLIMWTLQFGLRTLPNESDDSFSAGMRLAIKNVGNRTIDKCTVVLMVPPNAPFHSLGGGTLHPYKFRFVGGEVYNGTAYERWEFDVEGLFVENHTVPLPYITFNTDDYSRDKDFETPAEAYGYRLITADGAFPSPYSYDSLCATEPA